MYEQDPRLFVLSRIFCFRHRHLLSRLEEIVCFRLQICTYIYVHVHVHTCVQWKLSIVDANQSVFIREVSLFQRLICTQKHTIGTSETVLTREVSLFWR